MNQQRPPSATMSCGPFPSNQVSANTPLTSLSCKDGPLLAIAEPILHALSNGLQEAYFSREAINPSISLWPQSAKDRSDTSDFLLFIQPTV